MGKKIKEASKKKQMNTTSFEKMWRILSFFKHWLNLSSTKMLKKIDVVGNCPLRLKSLKYHWHENLLTQ